MHEWSTAREIAAKVIESGSDATAVTRVQIRLGADSHVAENTFRDRLDVLFAGTNAEGATIAISRCADSGVDLRLESIVVAD